MASFLHMRADRASPSFHSDVERIRSPLLSNSAASHGSHRRRIHRVVRSRCFGTQRSTGRLPLRTASLRGRIFQPDTVASLGKPSPDDGGTIRMAWPLSSTRCRRRIIYEARIAAVGAGGSGISDPSNSFSFPVTCTYAVTPSNRSVGVAGGSLSFSVAAPPDARGAHPRAKDGSEWPAAVRESAVAA